jgi:hypothetical protein
LGLFLSTTSYQLKHMVSLACSTSYLGFLLSIVVHKLILVFPKSCNVLFTTTIQLMLMLRMFPMGKICLVSHNKDHMGHLLWKKTYFMNMWKNARGRIFYWCKNIMKMDLNEKQQRKGKFSFLLWSLNFLVGSSLITKLTLRNTPFLKTWSYTLQKVTIHYPLLRIHRWNGRF